MAEKKVRLKTEVRMVIEDYYKKNPRHAASLMCSARVGGIYYSLAFAKEPYFIVVDGNSGLIEDYHIKYPQYLDSYAIRKEHAEPYIEPLYIDLPDKLFELE